MGVPHADPAIFVAAGVLGAAIAGWELGKAINGWFELEKATAAYVKTGTASWSEK